MQGDSSASATSFGSWLRHEVELLHKFHRMVSSRGSKSPQVSPSAHHLMLSICKPAHVVAHLLPVLVSPAEAGLACAQLLVRLTDVQSCAPEASACQVATARSPLLRQLCLMHKAASHHSAIAAACHRAFEAASSVQLSPVLN